jgi:hypothetical protein
MARIGMTAIDHREDRKMTRKLKDRCGLQEHMQRFTRPDGFCLWCGEPANEDPIVGPIMVTIAAPDATERHEFCGWDCFADWAVEAAGGLHRLITLTS